MSIQILSYEQLETNVSKNIQDIFMSSCAYFDVQRIIDCLKNKIIPELQHFYVLITAYVGVKQRINNEKRKHRRDHYMYYSATGTGINECWKSSVAMSYKDFHFKYMVEELLHIIKLFVGNGFVCDKNVYKALIFLNIDMYSIEHLFKLNEKEKQEIKLKYQDVYKQFVEENHKSKQKITVKEQKTKSQLVFEKLCRSYTLGTILECKRQGKKISFTQTCIRSSIYNFHTEVFEFFHFSGYVPSLDDINLISKIDRRFLLLLRFYPDSFEDKNNYKDIEKQLEKSSILDLQKKCMEIKEEEKIINEAKFKNKYYNKYENAVITLCDMYDPLSKNRSNMDRFNVEKKSDSDTDDSKFKNNIVVEFDNVYEYSEEEYEDYSESEDEVLVKKKK